MTGLDLQTFLRLLRADLGAWASLGIIALVLVLMTWTSWGSRRVLRKCLVLSIIAHLGLLAYGRQLPLVMTVLRAQARSTTPKERIAQIRVDRADSAAGGGSASGADSPSGRPGRRLADWDGPTAGPSPELALAVPDLRPRPAEMPRAEPVRRADPATPAGLEADAPADEAAPPPVAPEARSEPPAPAAELPAWPARVVPSAPGDSIIAAEPPPAADDGAVEGPAVPTLAARTPGRPATPSRGPREVVRLPREVVGPAELPPLSGADGDGGGVGDGRPPEDRPDVAEPATPAVRRPVAEAVGSSLDAPKDEPAAPPLELAMPELNPRRAPAAPRRDPGPLALAAPRRIVEGGRPPTIERATPAGTPRLPEVPGATGGRPLPDVPEVYRSRLDPNRSALAQRAGASAESEQAVERALAWLVRHQDADGRWNGGQAKYTDGSVLRGQADFTQHCPAGDLCSGPCFYHEADTAMTGLALLAYLGAGYTHTDGKYAQAVDKGLQFLLLSQKADGDLRGGSPNVGMYCHAMASLALCEAYALTGDPRLREPVARAVGWIVRSKSKDGLAWRYEPGATESDTSILGWIILVLKSAKVVGVPVPPEVRSGAIGWLARVADGREGGLAKYQPGQPIKATMTAEAWVCRQFLGIAGPGPASDEAAAFLLAHGPNRDPYNLYYWYYGTLAMYQHGGASWARWNAEVRDGLVRRQKSSGHADGSWDPEDCTNQYDARGGRIYCTAVATLTLEVYYRYLRLYDDPGRPPAIAPAPERDGDAGLRRASGRRN